MQNCETLFLLGAGASYESGLPLASGLFDLLLSNLQSKNKKWYDLIKYLKEVSNNSFEDAISSLDFINSQNSSDNEFKVASYLSNLNININKNILVDVYNLIDYIKRDWVNEYFKVTDNSKIQYLIPFIKFAHKDSSEIFTLNYDNTLEKTCELLNVNYSIGLDEESSDLGTKFFSIDNFGSKKLNIYKLHGSVDLFISQFSVDNLYNNIFRPSKQYVDNKNKNFDKPAIILGSKNKLTSEAMYLDLLFLFKNKLKQAKQICIVGYGFTDNHINKFLQNAWFKYPKKTFIIVDPCLNTGTENLSRSFFCGAYSKKGNVDYRNIFFSSENIQNNKLLPINNSFGEFAKKLCI